MDGKIDRRDFLKKTGIFSGGVMLSSSAPAFLRRNAEIKRPNVIFIMTDQMRGDALSCLGNPNARTPNLDNMAKDGVMFENAFSNNSVCAPSRISMFTGTYPHQNGALGNRGPFLNSLENTMFELFLKKGYKTGFFGKNHMIEPSSILEKSLDTTLIRDREPFRAYSKYVTPFWHCDTYWPSEECYTTVHTNKAVQFIETNSNNPFFLVISYQDPHPPYMAPSEYTTRFSSKDMVIPEYIPASDLCPLLDKFYKAMRFDKIKDSDLIETLRFYYATVCYIDDMMERLIDTLKRKGILDNTIVIFTSDHGDFMGEHRMVRKGMFHYDALLHVPNIWYAPGLIKPRFGVKNMVQSVDFMPTIADFLGVNIPDSLPGRSLKNILQGDEEIDEEHSVFAAAQVEEIFLDESKFTEKQMNYPLHSRVLRMPPIGAGDITVMIRTLEWKLIQTEGYPNELYKMDGGWIERENLAQKSEYADIVSSFEKKINKIWPEWKV